MTISRMLLGFAALLLFATAAFHASGTGMVAGWLDGTRGRVLEALWVVPVVDWAVVGVIWLFAAWSHDRRLAPLIWISTAVPLLMAALLIKAVGAAHPGIWMLVVAALLAAFGAARLPKREPA